MHLTLTLSLMILALLIRQDGIVIAAFDRKSCHVDLCVCVCVVGGGMSKPYHSAKE